MAGWSRVLQVSAYGFLNPEPAFCSEDAAIIPAPGDMKALALGDVKLLLDVGTIYKLPMGGISTSLAKIRENPAEVGKVVRAAVGATRFIVDSRNKDEVLNYLAAGFKLERNSSRGALRPDCSIVQRKRHGGQR